MTLQEGRDSNRRLCIGYNAELYVRVCWAEGVPVGAALRVLVLDRSRRTRYGKVSRWLS
jgi:hypothetical protein